MEYFPVSCFNCIKGLAQISNCSEQLIQVKFEIYHIWPPRNLLWKFAFNAPRHGTGICSVGIDCSVLQLRGLCCGILSAFTDERR